MREGGEGGWGGGQLFFTHATLEADLTPMTIERPGRRVRVLPLRLRAKNCLRVATAPEGEGGGV